jgi:ATP-dependent protease ClpP protease subunit
VNDLRVAAEIAKLEAETRLILAQAVKEEQEAVIRGIKRLEEEQEQFLSLAGMFTHSFKGEFDEDTVGECLDAIDTWHKLDENSDWHIRLNSPGGYVNEGNDLLDTLEAHSIRGGGTHHITITVRGMAASMAGILLQIADERVMGPRATLLIHPISSWFGGTRGEMRDKMDNIEILNDEVARLFLERAGKKLPKKRLEEALLRKDWWISSSDALKWGLCDRIG